MTARVNRLKEEMSKLQEDHRKIQTENAQITARNQKLEQEMDVLRDANEKLKGDVDRLTKGKTKEAVPAPNGASSAISKCTEYILGLFERRQNVSSSTTVSESADIPADVQNRLERHSNNRK